MATDFNKFPRKLTDIEWGFFSKTFPKLVRENITVEGPKDQKYNCISWSLGFKDRWIDVGETKEGLATLYAHYYHIACDTASAEIDAYAVGAVPKHAAKHETGSTWSSKMQVQSLLRHPRQELEGNDSKNGYGEIYGHFKAHETHPGNNHPTMPGPDHPDNHEQPTPLPVGHPDKQPPVQPVHPAPPSTLHQGPSGTHATPPSHPTPPATHQPPHHAPQTTHPPTHPTPPATHGPSTSHPTTHAPSGTHPTHGHVHSRQLVSSMGPFDHIPPPTQNAIVTSQQVHSKLQEAFPPAVGNFEKLFDAWKATWHTPEMEFEANSSARAKGSEFENLVKLGPAIIPLVVKKLAEPDNFFAIQLYNALEKDEGVKIDPSNVLDHHVLQRQANLIVNMNHERAATLASKVNEWKEYQDTLLSGNSKDYLDHDSYRSMVQMGPGVMGHVMHHYADDPSGWWSEMLHEMAHGNKSGTRTFYKDRLFADWQKWFEKGQPLEEAPKSG